MTSSSSSSSSSAASGPAQARHFITDEQRARIWEQHLRGVPKLRIAGMVGVERGTVARVIAAFYRELAADEGKQEPKHKLAAAIARLRRIQEQAWDDHDRAAGDERGQSSTAAAQHLRIALDAEKEIARLEGLYEGVFAGEAALVVRIERRSAATGGALVSGAPTSPTSPSSSVVEQSSGSSAAGDDEDEDDDGDASGDGGGGAP